VPAAGRRVKAGKALRPPNYACAVGTFVQDVLTGVPPWVVYLAVFALPFLEASVLLGFVFPGETALIFGGVLAGQHRVSLTTVLVLAVLGATTGDAVGYAVGRRYGSGLQSTRLGRVVGEQRWRTTEDFLQRRGGAAVFFGRYTALLRALVPGAAGMAGLPYRRFFAWNVLGGATWASLCVLGGYLVGDVISRYISNAGYVLIGLVVLAVAVHLLRKRRSRATSDQSAH